MRQTPATPRRALVIIDVQNEYFDGSLKIDFPDPAQSLANICTAAQAARAAEIPLVVVQQVAPEAAPVFARGSHGFALHPKIAELPAALHVEKTLPSSFTGTALESWARERGIDTFTVCGYMTHNCVNSTIVDAVHRGFQVEFLADASGSLPYENAAGQMSGAMAHQVFSVVFQSRFAAVMTTQDWLAVLAGRAQPIRDNIPASHRRAID